MRSYRHILSVGLALLFTTPAAALEVGDAAPNFTLKDIVTLENFSLSDFGGQVVVLNFWGYW